MHTKTSQLVMKVTFFFLRFSHFNTIFKGTSIKPLSNRADPVKAKTME